MQQAVFKLSLQDGREYLWQCSNKEERDLWAMSVAASVRSLGSSYKVLVNVVCIVTLLHTAICSGQIVGERRSPSVFGGGTPFPSFTRPLWVDAGERGVLLCPLHHQLQSKCGQFLARKPQVSLSAYCCWHYLLNIVSGSKHCHKG